VFGDELYEQAGATIVAEAATAWAQDLVVKVKEPLPQEYRFLREDLLLFTYLHLAAQPDLVKALLHAKTTAIAYEMVELNDGRLPLLHPMSVIAGRLAVQFGSHFLQRQSGGRGVLLGGCPGGETGTGGHFGGRGRRHGSGTDGGGLGGAGDDY